MAEAVLSSLCIVFLANENVVCSPEHTVQLYPYNFFCLSLTLLEFKKHGFIINIFIHLYPDLTDVRASSSCAAFPLWNRQCPGQGRQGRAQPGLDSSLPRSKHTVLGGRLPETSPPQPRAKIQMCKIVKSQSVELEMNFTSQAVKISSNFTIPYISRKTVNRG